MAKTDYDLDVLIHETRKAVDCYEKYLLDVSDWRDLAKIMKTLLETIEAIEKKRKHGK